MKKVLFIDRDGTLILESPTDYQVDSLEKLEFYPGVFRWLGRIAEELDFELVMVTNQDGLGTSSFPEETFWPAHNRMLSTFENEDITFSEVLIDRSFPSDGLATRKPGTGMLTHYLKGDFSLTQSFVIGDRRTDMELAQNLGCQGIRISDEPDSTAVLTTTEWSDIYTFLQGQHRKASVQRQTLETDIRVGVDLDGAGKAHISTGLGFLDHMLEQIARHGGLDLEISVKGDLHVDEHHTVEDTALALGEAIKKALGAKKGIDRYGFLLPMDDCLAQVALDFGGRNWLVWEVDFFREKIGDVPTEMFSHFFKSFSDAAHCNLNISAQGQNEHHKIEAIFKAFARSIKMAVQRNQDFSIPSTKGRL